ncbi:MAG TPA: serine hydrolase domain-containing protein [Verrucomicrobiae bacterium]|nr:serine hydrolase domain-containing protein [Verrucomicrobiae bacterium]
MTFNSLVTLGLKIIIGIVVLVLVFVIGVIVYAYVGKRKYEKVTDTNDLKARIAKLAEPYMAKRTNGALVIGVLQNGKEHVQGFGGSSPPDRSTVYEIGSVTKVFTALTLAKLSADGLIKLDEPVRKCFPNSVNIPTNITFRHLATHSSGLPRLPDNFFAVVGSSANPYIRYTKEHLYKYFETAKKLRDPGKPSGYSNLGFGLLGHALELCAGKPYATLVREHVFVPLGMDNTGVTNANVIPGHDPKGKPTPNWDFDVMAPAGVFRSNAEDMLKFLRANLEPDRTPIAAALRECKKPNGRDCGLGWQIKGTFEGLAIVWHNGGTAGYRSFVGFDPQNNTAVVLLSNYGDAFANDDSIDKMGIEILKLASKISL